ncbi:MAG: hypothetical protein BWK78_05110 [Thiotrichaceae bacterium IS1]|nr:MAG: hypothetical protein BWK78_05110 [Thiotrichaceae bacterium IS1]
MSEHDQHHETSNVSQEITMTGGSIEKQINVSHAETVNVNNVNVVVQQDHKEEEYHRPEIDFPNLDHFRGRTDKVNELTDKLTKPSSSKVRVLLTGMGGVGKTFLAFYVLKNLIEKGYYPEGQIYLDLRGYAPKSQPPITVEEALTFLIHQFYPNDPASQSKTELRQRWLEIAKDKQIVLFLDNADDEKLLESLLLNDEACTVVMTSRRRLPLDDVRNILYVSLEPMLPEDAIAFLIEFANLQQPNRLTEANAKRLAELCGYLPLALNIAVKTIRTKIALDIEQYLKALAKEKQRLRRLRLKGDDARDSVEASLNLSIEKLDPELVRLWEVLGVFVGSFVQHDVQHSKLWPLDEDFLVNEKLSELEERSLVQFIPTPEQKHKGYYSLHDLLRDIALQRLEGDKQEEFTLKRLYAVYYRDILEEADRRYGVDNFKGLDLFDEVQANILAAHAWVKEHFTEDKSIAQDAIYYPLYGAECLRLRLPSQRRIEWLKTAIAAAEYLETYTLVDTTEIQAFRTNYAKLFINLGIAYNESQQADDAITCYEQALKLAREIGNSELKMLCLNNLAIVYQAVGQLNEAVWCYRKALQQARSMEQKTKEELSCLVNLATVYEELGEIDEAFQYAKDALTIVNNIKDFEGIANGCCNLGNLYVAVGKYDEALEHYQVSLKHFNQMNVLFDKGILIDSIARLWIDKDNYLEAIKWAQEGIKIGTELDNHRILSECNGALALAYLFSGDLAMAHTTVEIALTYTPSRGNHQLWALKGIIALGQKETVVAEKAFKEALRQSDELLERNSQNYQAQETQALSRSGLGLCENDKSICCEALEKLSQPSPTPGLVKRMQRLLNKMMEFPLR